MNIAHPVSDAINGVEFGFLSSAEIQRLSVKRIYQSATFNNLLHPTPGGLYDPALGAFLDNKCSTCKQDESRGRFGGCPGHAGHIELPMRVYHPFFMDQCLKLVRGSCAFCHRFQLGRPAVARYVSKLRLLQAGLLQEACMIDALQTEAPKDKDIAEEGSESESEDEMVAAVVETYRKFTNKMLRGAREEGRIVEQNEAVIEMRKDIIREALDAVRSPSMKCANCQAFNPAFRKDKYVKIFRKPLQQKKHTANLANGLRAQNPVVVLRNRRLAAEKAQAKEQNKHTNGVHSVIPIDEGVADMESPVVSSESEDSEMEVSDPDGEDLTTVGDMVVSEATMGRKNKRTKAEDEARHQYISPDEVHAALVLLFEQENELLKLIYNPRASPRSLASVTPDMFFVDTLLVSPSRYRPEAKTGNGAIAEAGRNNHYRDILKIMDNIAQISREMRGEGTLPEYRTAPRGLGQLQAAHIQLQDAVNSLYDIDKNPIKGGARNRQEEGIKQVLEKKEGLFRMNMMGKRVNFAARSVISPDPNIETNEIGVPPVFAKKLTYPEPVTSHNFYELKEAILRGPDEWPGAVAVENENGQVIALAKKNQEERMAIANQLLTPSNAHVNGARNKKVHRHLNNGDIVIMNRQPTLHKPSMMCHRAKVLPGERTIRMHYANCNTYNADFDGDEMNMHLPQNEIARAEAIHIANTDNQYLSSTAGKPLRGLIQDHISMAVQLTNRDVFYGREDYQQLLYSAIRPESNHTTSGTIIMLPPAIMKPVPLWTGKQLISTVLKNIIPEDSQGLNFVGKSQTSKTMWGEGSEEQEVHFRNGELLCGILDKAQIGPAQGGLVNCVYEAYGSLAAGQLLSILGRLLTKVLHMRAHSCGVEDLILTKQGNDARKDLLRGVDGIGLDVASEYVALKDRNPKADDPELRRRLERVLRDDSKQAMLDELMKMSNNKLSGDITTACLPHTLIKLFPKNQMQAMTGTGAKGSGVNANQISCNLGQQVLEGRRVPIMVSGKSLPSFRPFDPSIRAGGYIMGRFLTGLKPQEYFFHMMSGREGLIDTAVKTSRSGYLQRCLIKGMEGLKVEYDTSVRDSDGTMVQFLYGEDGLDVAKSQYLTNFTFLSENHTTLARSMRVTEADFKSWEKEEVLLEQKEIDQKARKGDKLNHLDPVMSRHPPSTHLGSTSEKFWRAATIYVKDNKDKTITKIKSGVKGSLTAITFNRLARMKYLKTLVEPGEAVGVVAGQSIGEPSTQMTLNTFHLAGHSSKNVTLGIPRLREILMTASANISTPSMTLYPISEMSTEDAEKFAKSISRLSLADVVDRVDVSETLGRGTAYTHAKTYKIRMSFFPSEDYCREYAITPDDVFNAVARRFLPTLGAAIRKELKKQGGKMAKDARPAIGKSVGRIEAERPDAAADEEVDEEADSDDDDVEGGASNAKTRANRTEGLGYEAPDADEERIRTRIGQQAGMDDEMETGDDGDVRTEVVLDSLHQDYDSDARSISDEDSDANYDQDNDSGFEEGRPKKKRTKQEQEAMVKGISGNMDVASFKFNTTHSYVSVTLEYPAESRKILMLHLVEKYLHSTVIHAVPGMKSCLLNKNNKYVNAYTGISRDEPCIETDGINLKAMREDQQARIDPHRIFTNDIVSMLQLYGVEAARATIIRELHAVFSGHGISVDIRHLNLISDFMTRAGGFRPFNRLGMKYNASPCMKMSFETTVGFLREAVLEGEREEGTLGTSARIVLGRMGGNGTGGFGVFSPAVGEEGVDGTMDSFDIEEGEGGEDAMDVDEE